MNINRGDILLINLEPVKGSEQGRVRPCLVVQSDLFNKYSPTTIIVPITSHLPDKNYPQTIIINKKETGLKKDSSFLCNQLRTISTKERAISRIGKLNLGTMKKVDEAIKISLGLL
jgi:mRNA interferase MazF